MTTLANTASGHPIQDAHRAYAASHLDEFDRTADLLDFCSSLGDLELEAHHLGELMSYAADCGAKRGPVLRAHLSDLRQIRDEAAALVAEAEAA